MTVEVWAIRHGETEANARKVLQGHLDFPLTGVGLKQARYVGRFLKGLGLDFKAIFTSDLGRALKTAEIISEETGVEVISTPSLREATFGEWDGKSVEEIKALWGKEWGKYLSDPKGNPPPGGEGFYYMSLRVRRWLDEILKTYDGERVIAVTHRGPVVAMVFLTLGIEEPKGEMLRRFFVDNGSVTVVRWGNHKELLAFGVPPWRWFKGGF